MIRCTHFSSRHISFESVLSSPCTAPPPPLSFFQFISWLLLAGYRCVQVFSVQGSLGEQQPLRLPSSMAQCYLAAFCPTWSQLPSPPVTITTTCSLDPKPKAECCYHFLLVCSPLGRPLTEHRLGTHTRTRARISSLFGAGLHPSGVLLSLSTFFIYQFVVVQNKNSNRSDALTLCVCPLITSTKQRSTAFVVCVCVFRYSKRRTSNAYTRTELSTYIFSCTLSFAYDFDWNPFNPLFLFLTFWIACFFL